MHIHHAKFFPLSAYGSAMKAQFIAVSCVSSLKYPARPINLMRHASNFILDNLLIRHSLILFDRLD